MCTLLPTQDPFKYSKSGYIFQIFTFQNISDPGEKLALHSVLLSADKMLTMGRVVGVSMGCIGAGEHN